MWGLDSENRVAMHGTGGISANSISHGTVVEIMDMPDPTEDPTIQPSQLCLYCSEPVFVHPQIVDPDDEDRHKCFGVFRVE